MTTRVTVVCDVCNQSIGHVTPAVSMLMSVSQMIPGDGRQMNDVDKAYEHLCSAGCAITAAKRVIDVAFGYYDKGGIR